VQYRRLLVTGCGRSGTTYVSLLLRRCRLHVPHERKIGRDGIASWLFGAEASVVPWGPTPAGFRFEHVVQLVRDPLKSIPSIATFRQSAWDYIGRHVPCDPSRPMLARAAAYWLHWNALIEKRATIRLRTEDLPAALPHVCAAIGASVELDELERVPRDLNTRRHGRIFASFETRCLRLGLVPKLPKALFSRLSPAYEDTSWADLFALDPALSRKVFEKASEYGYRYATSP